VADLLRPWPLQCLAVNQNGSPKHPLYVGSSTPLRLYIA